METDRAILASLMPDVEHLIIMDREAAFARGTVFADAGADTGVFEPVDIEMRFSTDYPLVAPDVWERGGRWVPVADRHMYGDGRFCLGLPGIDLPDTARPEDFEYFLKQLLVFLHYQFIYDATKKWPGRQWLHGDDAYAQYAVEALEINTAEQARRLGPLLQGQLAGSQERCPCGSGTRFEWCHARVVKQLRTVQPLVRVSRLTERMARVVDVV